MDTSEDDLLDNVADGSGYMIQRMNVDNSQLLGTEILQTANGLVVGLGGDYIPYTSEDLLSNDIAEESASLPSIMTTLDGSKVRITEQVLVHNKATGLIQIVDAEELYNEDFANYETDGTQIHLIKTNDDDEEDEDDDEDDVEQVRMPLVAQETRKTSRKSLPHKKRIARKAKRITKVQKCTFCDNLYRLEEIDDHQMVCTANISSTMSTFSCQLCSASFGDQLSFFEHLKKHYEPQQDDEEFIEQEAISAEGEEEEEEEEEEEQEQHEISDEMQHDELDLKSEVDIDEENTEIKIETPDEDDNKDKLLSSTLQLICLHCNKMFRRQKTFETHMRDFHKKCATDDFNEEDDDIMASIAVHQTEDSKEWYPEEELQATEEDLKELEAKDHACPNCEQLFPMHTMLLQHLETCSVEEQIVETAKVPMKAVKGKTTKHKKQSCKTELECTVCGRKFCHRNSLVYHMRSHTSDRPYQCDQCGKSFFAASALKVHLRLHSGEKPFKCEYCGRQFRQWGDLKYHCISIHSDQKQFQCEFCGKEFARKYSLIVHRRIHTGEKNYRCEFCGKTFRASSYLQNHRRIHTGEKPHPCEICQKRFRVKSDMKRHMQTHTERKRIRLRGDVAACVKIESDLRHESDDTNESLILKTEDESGVQALEYEQEAALEVIRESGTIYSHLPTHVLIA